MKKSGFKIKRSRTLYGNRRKSRIKSILAIVFTVITVGLLVFLGYSVGEPVINFFKNWNSNSSSSSEPWSPSDIDVTSSEDVSDDSSNTEVKAPDISNYTAYTLSTDDLLTEGSIQNAVDSAKLNGFTAIVAPLKSDLGYLYYNSNIEKARNYELVKSSVSAEKISEIIRQKGLVAIADIQVLKDNQFSYQEKEAGFTFENSTSAWYDNDPSAGGKPWLSPFSDSAKDYIMQISSEVSSSGFDMVLCSDVSFPTFRNSDLNYIGAIVKDPSRYKSLINLVNVFYSDCTSRSIICGLQVDSIDLLNDVCEVYKPSELPDVTLVCSYDLSDVSPVSINNQAVDLSGMSVYDRVKTIFEGTQSKTGDYKVIPLIYQSDMQSADLNEALRAISDLGYKTYIVK